MSLNHTVDRNANFLGQVVGASLITVVNGGATAGTARPSGAVIVYWIMNNGVTPTNATEGDLIYNAPA